MDFSPTNGLLMEDHINLLVKKVVPETFNAITLVLEDIDGKLINYKPGQFLTFIFNIHRRELRRSYSLSSAPGIDHQLAVTIKRVQNGEVSRHLFNNVSEGSILKALKPAGRFTIQPAPQKPRDIFLYGAGSGIVPLFSILKTVLATESESRIHLIYSNHNESSIIFKKQLEILQETYHDRFNCLHLLSNPSSLQGNIIHGHLNSIILEEFVSKYLHYEKSQAVFYICGPFAYMRMVLITLPLLGFSHEQIYREVYLPEINESKVIIPPHNVDAKVTIHIGNQRHEIYVAAGKTILKAALENGIKLPYSCEAGICSTCSAVRVEGKVEMSINEVLTDKDLVSGLVLTCTGYPVSPDVSIRF